MAIYKEFNIEVALWKQRRRRSGRSTSEKRNKFKSERKCGHINPVVTYCLFMACKVSLVRAVAYILAHRLGDIFAADPRRSAGDSHMLIGAFPEFAGEEFVNFMKLAEKLHTDYDIRHPLDAKLIPQGGPVNKPTLNLLKLFEDVVDFQDFQVVVEKFVKEATVPIVTVWDSDLSNHPYINKFFDGHAFSELQHNPRLVPRSNTIKGKGISFLL